MKRFNISNKLIKNWGISYFSATRDEMIKCFSEEEFSTGKGVCIKSSHKEVFNPVVWAEDDNIFTIIHEVCHATFDIMDKLGFPIDNEEVFCVIHEYFVKEILKKLGKLPLQ